MQNIKSIKYVAPKEKEKRQYGLYKITVNPKFTKIEIKKMVETLFNVKVLKINTSRRYHSKRSLINQLAPAPTVLKHVFVKTQLEIAKK